jgi:hypothetical protein
MVKAVAEGYEPQALPGVAHWLDLLKKTNVPMAVISDLPGIVVENILEESGLADYFDARVTAEDDFKGDDLQSYLRASLKIRRAPNRCTIFDCRPHGCLRVSRTIFPVQAVHNCAILTGPAFLLFQAHEGMYKAVALAGVHPVYELTVADHTVLSFEELRIQNIRRLFADRQYEPETELEPLPQPKRKLRVAVATKVEEEEMEPEVWTEEDDGGGGIGRRRNARTTPRRRW